MSDFKHRFARFKQQVSSFVQGRGKPRGYANLAGGEFASPLLAEEGNDRGKLEKIAAFRICAPALWTSGPV